MNTEMFKRNAKQHGSKIAWAALIPVIAGLIAGWNDNRTNVQSNQDQVLKWHTERLQWQEKMEDRVSQLELRNAYSDGFKDGLTKGEKHDKN